MNRFESLLLSGVQAAMLLSVAACAATPRLDAQWTDPNIGSDAKLLRGAQVMVACEAPDLAVRQVCQERLAAEVRARGARPLFVAPDTVLTRTSAIDTQLIPGARAASAKAVLVMTLTPVATDTSPGLSIGIGGFGFGRGSALGGGVSAPIGGGGITTGFSANGRVTDATSGRLVWTASAVAPPSENLDAQFTALSKAVLDSAQRAGLF